MPKPSKKRKLEVEEPPKPKNDTYIKTNEKKHVM